MSKQTDAILGGWIDLGSVSSAQSWPDHSVRNVMMAPSNGGTFTAISLPDPTSQLVQPGAPYRVFNNQSPGASTWARVGSGEAWQTDVNEGYMAEFISDGTAWHCVTDITGSGNGSSTSSSFDVASNLSYAKYIDITITSNTPNINIFELARDREGYAGEDNTKITIRIPFGVTIGSANQASPCVTTDESSNYGSGCVILLSVEGGRIVGFGGNGGAGSNHGVGAEVDGSDAGDAIHVKAGPFQIHNIGGVITGGGGGGGGSEGDPGSQYGGNGGAGGLSGRMSLNGALLGSVGGAGSPGDFSSSTLQNGLPGNSGTGGTSRARGAPGASPSSPPYGPIGGVAGAFAQAGTGGTLAASGSASSGGAAGRTFVKSSGGIFTSYRGFGTVQYSGIGYQSTWGDGSSGTTGANTATTYSTSLFTVDGSI